MTTVYDGEDGLPGVDGLHSAVVQLFKRDTDIPDKPKGPLTYEFASGLVTGNSSHFNGWSHDMPTAGNDGKNLYVTMATAASTEATDTIEAHEWATPVEYVADGMHSASVAIYMRSATRPTDRPNGPLTYTFATGRLTGSYFNGWSQEIPSAENDKNPCWMLHATAANTTPTDVIEASEWSNTAIMLTENGQDGDGTQYVFKLYDHELTQQERVRLRPTRPQSMNEDGEWIDSTMIANGWTDDAQSPTQSLPYCYCAAIRRINGTWQSSYNTLELWSKWSKDGENGKDGKTYTIIFNSFSAVFDPNTMRVNIYFSGYVTMTEGNGTAETMTDGAVQMKLDTETGWGNAGFSGGSFDDDNSYSDLTLSRIPSTLMVRYVLNGAVLATASMPISIKGQNGQDGNRGNRGPALRVLDWRKCTNNGSQAFQFYQGAEGDPFKDVVVYTLNGTEYWYSCVLSHSDVRNPLYYSAYWEGTTRQEIVATSVLLAQYASIDNLWTKSIEMYEPGHDNDENYLLFRAKDGVVQAKTGTFENVNISGTVGTEGLVMKLLGNQYSNGGYSSQMQWYKDGAVYAQMGALSWDGTRVTTSLDLYGDTSDGSVNVSYFRPTEFAIQKGGSIYGRFRVYLDDSGRTIMRSYKWPSLSEASIGDVYVDGDGFLKVKK